MSTSVATRAAFGWLLFLLLSYNISSAEAFGAGTPTASERSFVCFVYHRFGDDRYPSTNVSIEDFRAHLRYLKQHDFLVMTLSDAVAYLKNDTGTKKVAVITVDDGYKTFLTGAMPLLTEFGYPATLFVNTKTIGSGDYLDWEELKHLSENGIEIGNHSHSHSYFLNISGKERVEAFKKDIIEAQDLLKEHLAVTPTAFAYPYGEFDIDMEQAVKNMGFLAAAAQNSGVMHGEGDYYAIPRFPMADVYAAIDGFMEKVNMQPLVVNEDADRIVGEQNPPVLQLTIRGDNINEEELQCFVQGGDCHLQVVQKQPLKITVAAKDPLKRRRTLYTITVPDKEGRWHWFSHLWIRPDIEP